MRTEIGKIEKIRIGMGGYQDACFGVNFTFGSKKNSWGVQTFIGAWADPPTEGAKWTVEQQKNTFAETFIKLKEVMKKANVEDANGLVGKPVEVSFNGNLLHSWRILEEVI